MNIALVSGTMDVGTVGSSSCAFLVVLHRPSGSPLGSALVCQRRARACSAYHLLAQQRLGDLATPRQGRNGKTGWIRIGA